MASIRKRTWTNKSGKHTCYEITYTIDGKLYRKSGYNSKLEAQLDMSNIILDTSTNIKFCALVSAFINRHCKLKCKQSTTDLYNRYISAHLQPLMPRIAKDIEHKDIENLIFSLKNKGLSNCTINKVLVFTNVVYHYGIENKFLSSSPIKKSDRLKEVKTPFEVLNEYQIVDFLNVAKNISFKKYALLSTAIFTGMRRGELLSLEWSDIDFKNGCITVSKNLYNKKITPPKNNKTRIVDIPVNLIQILLNYKKQQKILSKIVFCNSIGTYMHPSSMESHCFHKILKEYNKTLSDEEKVSIRFHDLRHTYATLLLSKGVPIKYVQEQLGHSSAKMTLDVYASYLPSVKNKALNVLENIENFNKIEHKLSIEK